MSSRVDRPTAPRRSQRGLSLVEMMVGIAVGLIVVAGATMLVSTQLGENRRLLLETQLQQDMRASMDIITRELRRIGAQSDSLALQGMWAAGSSGGKANVYAAVDEVPLRNYLKFGYQQPGIDPKAFGFKLEDNTIKSAIGNWQELTDPNVVKVTKFEITPRTSSSEPLPCPDLCPDIGGDRTYCWPRLQVREFAVTMEAEARNASEVKRTITSHVRLRNDRVAFHPGSSPDICPAP